MGSSDAPAVLSIDGLRTEIRQRRTVVRAVDGVSLTIRAGETVGLVGESGCGKTITGLSVLGLLPPGGHIVDGSIELDGRELVGLPEARLRELRGNAVSMIFQDPMTSLNPTMPVGRQIAETLRVHRHMAAKAALESAVEALDLVGVPQPRERLSAFPHQLSGGLRQRVMIAMALACRPRVLIADEPTTALDVTTQFQILTMLDRLKAELGMSMLLVTHDLGVIAGRADRVLVMYAGRVVEEAETVQLFDRCHHPYTEALLASIPQPDRGTGQMLYAIPGLPPDLSQPSRGCRLQPRCSYASEKCQIQDPPLIQAAPSHRHACFHPRHAPRAEAEPAQARGAGSLQRHEPRRSSRADPGGEPILEIDHLVKEFPVTRGVLQRTVGTIKAVSDVSLSVVRGETFGIVGESGCGKTTLSRLVVGLEKPTSGTIRFDGADLTALSRPRLRLRTDLKRLRRDIQLMFQDPYSSLDPRMRVGAILREPLVIHGIGGRREQNESIRSLLHEVGLRPDAVDLYPHEFSGGQRQRIGLARALMLAPSLLVADEPVSALDVSIRSQILNLMRELQQRHTLTCVLISHDLSVIRYMSDRIAVMYLGKLVEIGPSSEVYERAAHPYTAGLIAAAAVPNPRRERAKVRVPIHGELPSALEPPSGCRFRTRCPRAAPLCAEVEPQPVKFSPGHHAACHFPLQEPRRANDSPGAAVER
jgi:peptide/nickel transport system ATP-binding protein